MVGDVRGLICILGIVPGGTGYHLDPYSLFVAQTVTPSSSALLPIRLGVNVDHVATVLQARGTAYPDPVEAGLVASASGAHSITIHLREDRRHIQEHDVRRLKARCPVPPIAAPK